MTSPHLDQWPLSDLKYRRSEVTAFVGSGDAVWERVALEVLLWKVKTASGFVVDSPGPASPGDRVVVTARLCGLSVVEPVEVVDVVQEPDRSGFSYRTRPGHPVDGEEAFLVHRSGDEVHLTIRSLTRAAPQQPWRLLFPLLLIAQRIIQRRYLRALR
ncbi:DUF1990 family protein [Arthrobacter sp. UNC362MFTsu5.1]|uniref:DUF1990 family protein n=1 Tax=Arthrobacter sp. UNC362MFTsu5.1 TaxID=1449044 RepID=UPI0009DDF9A8|nr:DUF1990 family protein [Arthrobacter sp. UNC362MFTsu5.1]